MSGGTVTKNSIKILRKKLNELFDQLELKGHEVVEEKKDKKNITNDLPPLTSSKSPDHLDPWDEYPADDLFK